MRCKTCTVHSPTPHHTAPRVHLTRTLNKQQARCCDFEQVPATQHKMPQGGPLCLSSLQQSLILWKNKIVQQPHRCFTSAAGHAIAPDGIAAPDAVPAWRPSCRLPHPPLFTAQVAHRAHLHTTPTHPFLCELSHTLSLPTWSKQQAEKLQQGSSPISQSTCPGTCICMAHVRITFHNT